MKYLGIFFWLLALSSCQTDAKKTFTPDGQEQYLVHCEDRDICLQKAREACHGNYQVLDHSASMENAGDARMVTDRKMLVKCQKP